MDMLANGNSYKNALLTFFHTIGMITMVMHAKNKNGYGS